MWKFDWAIFWSALAALIVANILLAINETIHDIFTDRL